MSLLLNLFNKYKSNDRAIVLGLALLIVIFYFKSFFTYFQGDEWYYFIQFFPYTGNWYGVFQAIYKSIADTGSVSGGGHLTPISYGLWFLYNQIFGIHFLPYILSSISLHIVNTSILYLFVKGVTKNRLIAVLSALFFALSSAHQQAITWVMAFIWAQLSVTFLLLAMLLLTQAISEHQDKKIKNKIAAVFLSLLAGVLTKETVVIGFILIPIITYLLKPQLLTKLFAKIYLITIALYIPFRFIIPFFLVNKAFDPNKVSIGFDLYLYRAVTYPLKIIAETFIPWQWILAFAEFVTPYGYPTYGAEQSVRGTNFLIFTQTAGSDMLIYIAATIILFGIGIALKKKVAERNNSPAFNMMLIGLVIIFLSALPLLLIATYAPWWGYVTFIDSRHLYVASIGAALLFPYFIVFLAQSTQHFSSKIVKYKLGSSFIITCIVLLWSVLNYSVLQKELDKLVEMGKQRTTVVNKILKDNPTLPKKSAYLITSDTGYYGFGPIPPFQTNFGQVLTVLYYHRKQLPIQFMQSDYLSKGSLQGEGYKEVGDRGFGYYIDEKNFFTAVLDNNLDQEEIYSFAWNGKTNEFNNTSHITREKLITMRKKLHAYDNWQRYSDSSLKFSFRAPEGAQVKQVTPLGENILNQYLIQTNQQAIKITIWKKVFNIGVYEDISKMNNADDEVIGENFYMRNVPSLYDEEIVARLSSKGSSMQYFLPTVLPKTIIEVTVIGEQAVPLKQNALAEEIISLMRYPDVK